MSAWVLLALCSLLAGIIVRQGPEVAGRRPLVSANSVFILLVILYVIFPAFSLLLNDGSYFWAPGYGGIESVALTLQVVAVGLIAYSGVTQLMRSRHGHGDAISSREAEMLADTRPPGVGALELLTTTYLLIGGLALKLYLIQTTGGFEMMLLRLSGSSRELSGAGGLEADSLGVRTLSGMADAAATWALVRALSLKRLVLPWTLVWLLVIALSYVTVGKRLAILLPILAVVMAVHQYRRFLSLRWFPVAVGSAFLIGMGTLLFRIFVPARLSSVDIDLNQVEYARGSLFGFYFNSLEFSTVEMMSVAILARDEIISLFGGFENAFYELFVAPFAYTIPRAVWLEKPVQIFDLSYAVSSAVLGIPVEDASVGYITTIFGNAWVLGGLIGVFLSLAALAVVNSLVDGLLVNDRRWSPMRVVGYAFLVMLTFHLFRMGTAAWAFLIGVVQQYGYLLGLALLAAAYVADQSWVRRAHELKERGITDRSRHRT